MFLKKVLLMKSFRSASVCLAVAFSCTAMIAQSADTRIVIGTGGKAGVYYQAGTTLCGFVNRASVGIKCKAQSNRGANENFPKLRSGKYDFIVARSDWAKHATDGTRNFSSVGRDPNLRSVFSLHGEPLTVVARVDANISDQDDLKGKRLNLGPGGPGVIAQLLRAHKLGENDFAAIGSLKHKDQGKALCRGQFDAVFSITGYPSGYIQATAKKCAVNLVNLQSRQIDRLIAKAPELSRTTIPGGVYHGVDVNTGTFGYKSSLLTHANIPDQIVYDLVKSTFENLEKMRGQHPAWHDLQPSKMIRDSLVAPLHPGAIRYYRERGWLK